MAPAILCSVPDILLLPRDVVFEILLLLPAKELCRLRVVCQPWHSLLSDPLFVATHATRQHGALILVDHYPDPRHSPILFDIIDLSGRVIKHVRKTVDATEHEWVVSTHLGLVCVARGKLYNHRYRVLNPATGAVCVLPDGYVEEHAAQVRDALMCDPLVMLGQVPSTAEYKVLRVLDLFSYGYPNQLCEVFTVDSSGHAGWRAMKAPLDPVIVLGLWNSAVVNGVVYFIVDESFKDQDVEQDRIALFDLATEEWRVTVRGPLTIIADNADDLPNNHDQRGNISIACVNGCLVMVHESPSCSVELWFLMDFEKGLWVKQYSIPVKRGIWDAEYHICPLLVLNDGRIAIYTHSRKILRIYGPRISTSKDVSKIRWSRDMDLYTGNLLSLPNGTN